EQRIVRAPQNHGVHPGLLQRLEVPLRQRVDLATRGDPPLYEGDELRASLGNGGDVRTSSEEILVRPGGHRRLRPDQADAVVSGRGYGAADRGEDDLDDRDRVA